MAETTREERAKLNRELAQMLKGGVIMDVTTPDQARIAEEAGACAVMALERIPADIRAAGGVSRMSDPAMIRGIQQAVSIPVMAKCRIGHFAEAQILQAIDIDYIDESEVLSPADDTYHIDKTVFAVPFVCGARDLGEALRRIAEGATMIRTKGEPGTGDVVQAVRHMRRMNAEIRRIQNLRDDELFEAAKELQVPVELLREVHEAGNVFIASVDTGGEAARKMVEDIVKVPEVGEEYEGEVVNIQSFGAFVKLTPNKDGLLHISRVANGRVGAVEDVLSEGDTVKVKVIGVDEKTGKISLDRLDKPDAPEGSSKPRNDKGHGNDRRDRDRKRDNRKPRRRD